ncbi:MAG: tetratricopeptide repeat protein [Planctomycetes bacterium]|nr:tetratricopeptide repeat protein [Planctomycetota bacterium]
MTRFGRERILLFSCLLSGCAFSQSPLDEPLLESQRLVARSRQAEKRGDLNSAKRLLEHAAEINSEDASILHQLARLQSESGESQQAIERLRYAVTKNPQDTAAFVELSRILMQQNRYPEANQTLKAALQLDPNHIEALMLSGSWEERHNQTSLAMETYHRVLGIDSDHVEAKLKIALLQMKSGAIDRAAPTLRWICQSDRADEAKQTEAYWSLGILYGLQDRWSDAVDSLSAALSKRKTISADDWYRLAYARYKAGDKNGAGRNLQTALRNNPNHAAALAMAAALQYETDLQDGRIINVGAVAAAVPAPPGW